jgi:hypothetical protein
MAYISGLSFLGEIGDQPLEASDTVVIKTATFKLSNVFEYEAGVTFKYEQLYRAAIGRREHEFRI